MGGREEEGCRSWEEDVYWTHFQFIHFTQFLRNDFDQQLALPKTFSDNIKKKLPESVTLKGPGGALWNIELTTRDGTLYFTNGWQQFVKEHSLKENDFLVFKYNGESLFEVLIFDGESFCEKAACYFVRKCRHAAPTEHGGGCSSKKRDSDNSVEEVNTPSNGVDEGVSPEKPSHLDKIRVPFAVPIEITNGKTSNAGVESASAEQFMSDAVVNDTEPITVPSQTTGKRTRKPVYADTSVPSKRRGRPPKSAISHERTLEWVSDAELSPKVSPKASPKVRSATQELYTSNRRPVTQDEIENTLRLAQETCIEDTLLVTMRPSHVYKRFFVSFPNKWILNHLSPSSQDVILRMGTGEWVGKYCFHNIRNNGGLSGGWKHFALENNLEEFDVCLFKPAGYMQNTLILEMTIFRVVEEITPLTAVNSSGKKRSIKKTPSGEPQLKRRGVMITPIKAIQTELDSLEGA
ncbi:B3 domain-containing protein REM16-like [Vicia villosa]|uniref:B3 domain-containing protein REM16-like n=1 Tax=Vicia villosa TaxID=3911 RepID=UPI00273B874B|nr:B3 domain-containing protein REM16-like [Vicia villosa]XP_058725215.1 B3 domain-containing protein REM16-like [Vicia villosa]